MAVTVDDLPLHGSGFNGVDRIEIAGRIVDTFRRHGLHDVYGFVNGLMVQNVPESKRILEQWLAAGHTLANHSWSHRSLNDLSLADYVEDILRGEDILKALAPSSRWYRYPFLQEGNTAAQQAGVRRFVREHEYRVAPVSIDANDWAYNPAFARCKEAQDSSGLAALRRDFVEDHVAELRRDFVEDHVAELRRMREVTHRLVGSDVRHVLLVHIGVADADAMDTLLSAYEREGVRWIELQTALEDPFYELDSGGPYRGGAALPYRVAAVQGLRDVMPTFGTHVQGRISSMCP